jgi:hypothetical protein
MEAAPAAFDIPPCPPVLATVGGRLAVSITIFCGSAKYCQEKMTSASISRLMKGFEAWSWSTDISRAMSRVPVRPVYKRSVHFMNHPVALQLCALPDFLVQSNRLRYLKGRPFWGTGFFGRCVRMSCLGQSTVVCNTMVLPCVQSRRLYQAPTLLLCRSRATPSL